VVGFSEGTTWRYPGLPASQPGNRAAWLRAARRWARTSCGERSRGLAEEALTIINRLLDGETVTLEGEFFRTRDARLYTLPARRPPVYLSARLLFSRRDARRNLTQRHLDLIISGKGQNKAHDGHFERRYSRWQS